MIESPKKQNGMFSFDTGACIENRVHRTETRTECQASGRLSLTWEMSFSTSGASIQIIVGITGMNKALLYMKRLYPSIAAESSFAIPGFQMKFYELSNKSISVAARNIFQHVRSAPFKSSLIHF
jgi:hypothetical protein